MNNCFSLTYANHVNGGGRMNLRKICVEYRAEFIFGLVLSLAVFASYGLAYLIPVDFYLRSLNPILNGCIATVSLYGAIVLFRHLNGVHVRILWACTLLVWAALATMLLMRVLAYNLPFDIENSISLKGRELIIGDFYAWLLLNYPIAVLRPGWLNPKRALAPFIPVAVIVAIDRIFSVDLRILLALIPLLWLGVIVFHIRKYRIWCEENYSSMDLIDVQWIWRYITMYVILGVCYTCMSFSYTPSHAFTQQWLLLFILAYSTEQILFRQDPWVIIRRAKTLPPEPEESEEEDNAPHLTNAEYRAMLEDWMNKQKPYLNAEFRLLDLRQVLPLNRTYLSQLINTEYGCSFYQWVNRLRIDEAKRLMMEHPDMTIEDVSLQCGFSSPRSFYRTFAREVEMTPKEWLSSGDNS